MSTAQRDPNRVPAIQGVSSVDSSTPTDVVVNPTTGRTLVDVDSPLPTSSLNPSLELGYNAASQLVRIRKVIGATTYTKTIEESDMVVATTQDISSWS